MSCSDLESLFGGLVSEIEIIDAAKRGDASAIERLLAAGADVNEAAKDGTTALMIATVRRHTEYAKFLLNHGADPNLGPGFAPLHWAAGRWDSYLTDFSNGITNENTE